MGSIGSSLSSSQDVLANLTQQLRERDSSKVQTFQAYVDDVAKDNIDAARYMGDLRPNQNRLNGFSLMTRNETEDYYRFNVKFAGNVHLVMLTDSLDAQRQVVESETAAGLGVQVIQYQGSSHKVIADSDPNSGALYDMYQQLTQGDGARLTAGKYVVRVDRQPDTPQNQEFFYSFQLAGDRFYQDYDTMQREAPAHPPTKSKFELMTTDPAVTMLAANMDPTMEAAMMAATRPPTLVANTPDGTDPVTQLLDAFM
jgi:hypothetical protein